MNENQSTVPSEEMPPFPEKPRPTDADVHASFNPLFKVFERTHSGDAVRPLLAHYTSIQVMESILKNDEIWFSNPLFMNDLQEMRFGLNAGTNFFADIEKLKRAGGSDQRAEILQRSYFGYFQYYEEQQAFDTYIFCLSEHQPTDNDGLLSMWRGYGQHGNGVALVFDSSKVTVVQESPLLFVKVSYVTDVERAQELTRILNEWIELTQKLGLPDDQLHLASWNAFSLIKSHALITKNSGFAEENEWRVIYVPERDGNGLLKPYLHYHVGERGVEPKLKYKIGHLPGVSADDLALDRILDRIILGPSHSSPLAKKSVERLLDTLGKPNLKPLLRASGIPLRPTSGSSF